MIIEVADFKVRPEDASEFGAALRRALRDVLSKSEGYRRHTILVCQETPGRFLLQIEWTSLEAHTIGFRQSPAFAQWREIIGKFFAQPPLVEHFDLLEAS